MSFILHTLVLLIWHIRCTLVIFTKLVSIMKTTRKLLTAALVLLVWLGSWGSASAEERPFITKWQGVKGAELRIPIMGKEYKLVIKNAKGDVVKSEAKLTLEDPTKPYVFTPAEDGLYTVEAGPVGVTNIKMDGVYQGYDWIPAASSGSLIEVVQFGTVKWTTMENAFNRCCFMNFAKNIDVPDLSQVKSMLQTFSGCTSFNAPLKWDVSKVTDMSYMFADCASFNQPLTWDASEVLELGSMFSGCISLNSPLDFKLKKVTSMWGMFYGCVAFNQPLENWNVSEVENMLYLFSGCTSFNQPLEKWNVSKVSNMSGMFSGCTSFNQPLGKWKIQTGIGGLGETAMSPSNYSKSLLGWAEQTDLPDEISFGKDVTGLVYYDMGAAARKILEGKKWKFNGDIHQTSGLSIAPRSLSLAVGKELVLPFEKWGVEDTEKVTFTFSVEGVLSSELTNDGKGLRIKGLKDGNGKLTASIAAKQGVHDGYTSACEVEVYTEVKSITIKPDTKTLEVDAKVSLTPTLDPAINEENVIWSSSDASIATVSIKGEVTAKRLGKCTIFAKTMGSNITGKCEITVIAKGSKVAVMEITVSPASKTLKVDETETLTVTIAPDNATVKEVTWSSSDETVATVSEAGLVTAKKAGECTITAKSKEEGSTVKGECKVIVEAKTEAVEDATLASIVVSPNPFSSQLRIYNPAGAMLRYELVNAVGVVLSTGALIDNEVWIETNTLPAGIYFVRFYGENSAQRGIRLLKY